MLKKKQKSSFRDPSGFLFYENEILYRQVNMSYKDNYDHLMKSGLYEKLCTEGLLIQHKEIENHKGFSGDCYKVIQPKIINFISYPYEWCYSQLKDAALTTLQIQKICLEYGMSLKDSSAYNIQFYKGKPIFIDTLSFEMYEKGAPWVAYKQFCEHFLAPLALMSYTDIRLNQMLRIYLDGIPLDLASKLLPAKTKMSFSLLMHLHWHAKMQKKYEDKGNASDNVKIKQLNLTAIIESLESAVKKLKRIKQETEWGEYYSFTNYSDKSFKHKEDTITSFLKKIKPEILWDLGANIGVFTQIAAKRGVSCVAFDIDPLAVESHYQLIKENREENILPLIINLKNPSPAIGWNNEERMSFRQRSNPDTVFALALIHHLAISNNLPLDKIAGFFYGLCTNLIIEFVPKTDSQVQKLLLSREDIFSDYNEDAFEKTFTSYFNIKAKVKIVDSKRTVYWMVKKL